MKCFRNASDHDYISLNTDDPYCMELNQGSIFFFCFLFQSNNAFKLFHTEDDCELAYWNFRCSSPNPIVAVYEVCLFIFD